MTILAIMYFLILIQLKHFICDFLVQGPYQYLNKGNFKHPGGYLHAGITAFGTGIVFLIFKLIFPGFILTWIIPFIMVSEFIVHYLIDWSKVNICKKMQWGPTTHNEFWYAMGFDQLLHQLCYILMLVALV